MKGIDNASWEDNINEKMWRRKKDTDKPWEKYDLMKQYRSVWYLSVALGMSCPGGSAHILVIGKSMKIV